MARGYSTGSEDLLRLSKPHAEVSGYLRKGRKAENMTATMEKHPPLPMTMCGGRMQDAEDAMRSSRKRPPESCRRDRMEENIRPPLVVTNNSRVSLRFCVMPCRKRIEC
jgi:hypothetical protein